MSEERITYFERYVKNAFGDLDRGKVVENIIQSSYHAIDKHFSAFSRFFLFYLIFVAMYFYQSSGVAIKILGLQLDGVAVSKDILLAVSAYCFQQSFLNMLRHIANRQLYEYILKYTVRSVYDNKIYELQRGSVSYIVDKHHDGKDSLIFKLSRGAIYLGLMPLLVAPMYMMYDVSVYFFHNIQQDFTQMFATDVRTVCCLLFSFGMVLNVTYKANQYFYALHKVDVDDDYMAKDAT